MSDARKRAEEALAKWDSPVARQLHEKHSDAVDCVLALRALLADAPPADAATEAYAAFGRALLPLWWDDGNPGDIDGGMVQTFAEKFGLWHQVERHAEGVECDWCGNEGWCGELTEAGLSALSTPAPAPSAKEGRT